MARNVYFSAILATVRKRADIQAMTARHPDADLVLDINDSWQALREKVSDAGGGFYLKPTTIAAMTPGAYTGSTGGNISMPSDCVRIYGIDVYVTATDVRPMRPISFAERDSFATVFSSGTGIPAAFFVQNLGVENTNTMIAGKIGIYPAPDKAYNFVIWYVPAWTAISLANIASYVADGVAGWEDWVTWDCVIKVCARDNDMQACAAIAVQERDRCWTERILPACNTQRTQPSRRADIATINRQARSVTRFR